MSEHSRLAKQKTLLHEAIYHIERKTASIASGPCAGAMM